MKKYLLLLFCLVSSLMASAESGTCGDNLTWTLEDGVLTISGTGAMTNYSSSRDVPWYSSRSTISLVIISEGVTSIGKEAFHGCSSLTSITIPNSVTSIGSEAFFLCSRLTSITIPNSVTSIGGSAFSFCSGLTSITIPDGVTSIGDNAFYNCSRLASVSVLATTPPACGSDLLWYAGTSTIHVYNGFADAYKAASGWNTYTIVDNIPVVHITGITLDATSYQCGIGQRFTPQVVSYEPVDATIKEVTWSSSDPSTLAIASSTGVCNGLKDGIVTITATAKDSGHATATATVYVGNATPATYTISAVSADENMGTVSGAGVYAKDAEVTLTATPAEGYKFLRWSDGSTENPYIFSASENKTLTAEFKLTETDLMDGEAFTAGAEEEYESVTYTRTFSENNARHWQAWYVPFDLDPTEYADDFTFARIYMMAYVDPNTHALVADPAHGELSVVLKYLEDGELVKAGTPYVVRARQAGEQTFESVDGVLHAATENHTIASSTTSEVFTFTGNYEGVTCPAGWYAIAASGGFIAAEGKTLNPYRWHFEVTPTGYGSSVDPSTVANARMYVMDEDYNLATSIQAVMGNMDNRTSIYDLQGRSYVRQPKSGMFIQNGKKLIR